MDITWQAGGGNSTQGIETIFAKPGVEAEKNGGPCHDHEELDPNKRKRIVTRTTCSTSKFVKTLVAPSLKDSKGNRCSRADREDGPGKKECRRDNHH